MAESTNRNRRRTQSGTLYYSEDDDADHMAVLGSKIDHPASSSGTFTPPMPRVLSNTLSKIGNKSPTLKKKGFFVRHFSSGDSEPTGKLSSSKDNSPLSSPHSFSKAGVVVTSGRQAHRRSVEAGELVVMLSSPCLQSSGSSRSANTGLRAE